MRQIQLHVHISGDFRGTTLRAMARRQAEKLRLSGWILQHHSGALEAVINGQEVHVHTWLGWVQRGPLAQRVTDVQSERQPREAFLGFSERTPPPAPSDDD